MTNNIKARGGLLLWRTVGSTKLPDSALPCASAEHTCKDTHPRRGLATTKQVYCTDPSLAIMSWSWSQHTSHIRPAQQSSIPCRGHAPTSPPSVLDKQPGSEQPKRLSQRELEVHRGLNLYFPWAVMKHVCCQQSQGPNTLIETSALTRNFACNVATYCFQQGWRRAAWYAKGRSHVAAHQSKSAPVHHKSSRGHPIVRTNQPKSVSAGSIWVRV
eukprot:jgi/Botrbrau1/18603/Bobra.0367s0043.1